MKLLRLSGVSGGPDLDDAEIARLLSGVWETVFRDASDDELATAALAYLQQAEKPWWPMPAQLRNLIPRIAAAKAARAVDTSDADFAEARRIASSTQWGTHPDASPAIQAGVAALGSWDNLRELTNDTLPSMRAAFRGAHRAHVERGAIATDYAALTDDAAIDFLATVERRRIEAKR